MLALLVGIMPASAAPKACDTIHIVQRGETLYSIARRYGVDVWTIARANGITNPNCIYVGQRLVIPAGQPVGTVHVVQPGEMLTRIALRYGVDVWAIARANNITNLNHIYVGQRLIIPGVAPPVSPPSKPSPPQPSLPDSLPGPWFGEYFDNGTLGGTAYTTRYDDSINFNWGWGPPAGGMPTNHFSVRWTGTFNFAEGTYRFYARVDDGVRVYVDGESIIDGWRDGGLRLYTADRALAAGDHTVQVEYYDRVQVARVYFWWETVSGPTPTPTPTPMPIATPAPGLGWSGEYFNNTTLTGPACATRQDESIDFNWGWGSPVAGVPKNYFSVRWTGTFNFAGGTYRFHTKVDDGVRVYVDGERIIDGWRDGPARLYTVDRTLTAGDHTVRVEYYDRVQAARIHLWWETVSGPTPTPGPTPTSTPAPGAGWLGQFYNNMDLQGPPFATRYDAWIGFEWGTGAPMPGMHSDFFSIRWTTTAYLEAGTYRFCAMIDDGARMWVDDHRVLDEWHPTSGVAYCREHTVATGNHGVKVEYYEEGGDALIYVWWEEVELADPPGVSDPNLDPGAGHLDPWRN